MIEVKTGGIEWLLMSLGWSRSGLIAEIQVDPRIEEFFESLTEKQTVPMNAYGGNEWSAEAGADLLTYALNEETFRQANHFFMCRPGFGMNSESYPSKVNLSFLHLVGASKGLRFTIKKPVSGIAKIDLRMQIERGMQEFVRQYLTFGKMVIRVSSYEL